MGSGPLRCRTGVNRFITINTATMKQSTASVLVERFIVMLVLGSLRGAAYSISHSRFPFLRTCHPIVGKGTMCLLSSSGNEPLRKSVTGVVYDAETTSDGAPIVVKLFTKDECSLCDKVKDVLVKLRTDFPHTLEQVDITDPEHENYWNKFKYDIPVLFVNNQYWTKHRLDVNEARQGLDEVKKGKFKPRQGEPDAGAMEQRQWERKNK